MKTKTISLVITLITSIIVVGCTNDISESVKKINDNKEKEVELIDIVENSDEKIDEDTMAIVYKSMREQQVDLKTETFGESHLSLEDSQVMEHIKKALDSGGFDSSKLDTLKDIKLYKCELVSKSKIDQPVEIVAIFSEESVIGLFLNYHGYIPQIASIHYTGEINKSNE